MGTQFYTNFKYLFPPFYPGLQYTNGAGHKPKKKVLQVWLTLGANESVLLLVTVDVVSIDVIAGGVLGVGARQQHARVVEAQHVRVPVLG